MAFTKETDLLNGLSAHYWKLTSWSVDVMAGEAKGTFNVFAAREHAKRGGRVATDRIARIDLDGEDFDRFFGSGREPGKDDQTILYEAARVLGVNSDFGGEPTARDKKIKSGYRPLFKGARKS